jgi:hypothetical protein
VTELTTRIRAAIHPLTLHDADARRLALAQEIAWLLVETPGSRADLEILHRRVQGLLPHLSSLSDEALGSMENRVHAAQARLRAKGLRTDQVGHPYPWAEARRWPPRAALRLWVAAALLPSSLLFWPPYRLAGWIAGRYTDEGDQTATLKLLAGLFLYPVWTLLLAALAGYRWGWGVSLVFPLALLTPGWACPSWSERGSSGHS